MANDNILRRDVVEIALKSDAAEELQKLKKQIDDLKRKLGLIDDDSIDDVNDSAKNANKSLKIMNGTVLKLSSGLKKLATVSLKGLTIGLGAAAAGVGKIAYEATQAYADFEQLEGGVKKLFGVGTANSIEEYAATVGKSVESVSKDYENLLGAQDTVMKNAMGAYKTAGLSANKYMESVTGFSASLITSLKGDTQAAADWADIAVTDMADNANTFGTDMDQVITTYQNLAKEQYMTLDNLKLGFGGTKEGAYELVAAAAKLDKTIKAGDISFSNMVKAIHAVQKNMKISGISYKEYTELVKNGTMTQEEAFALLGTTAKEANFTVTGSLNQLKGAWENVLVAVGRGKEMDMAFDNFLESVEIFMNNAGPVLERALMGIGTLLEKGLPKLQEKLPEIMNKLLPPLIKAAAAMLGSFVRALPNTFKTIIKEIPNIANEIAKALYEAFTGKTISNESFAKMEGGIKNLGNAIKWLIPIVGSLVVAFKGLKGIQSIKSVFGGFGSKAASGGSGNGIGGLFNGLANAKITTVLKGITNMTLIVGALGGLLWVATKVFKNGVNFKEMLQVITLIGILGSVGGLLAMFASVVGAIPIPAVLLGLANIAIVIGGLSAIIVAFGALGEIPGFNEFINKGGDVLANIFKQLGKIVGAFVGGIGEGVTNSLPKIGENLSAFAESLKSMFTTFSSADMGGIGTFFGALAGFLLAIGAKGFLDSLNNLFGGNSSLSTLGRDLTAFAINAKGFFEQVATFPGAGFKNAASLFEALSHIGQLPGMGGFAQMFKGDPYLAMQAMTKVLPDLAASVSQFFTNLGDRTDFSALPAVFKALSSVSQLPSFGGLSQIVTGDPYKALLAFIGLLPLLSPAINLFYAGLGERADFSALPALFRALSSVSQLPSFGGLKSIFVGDQYQALAAMIAVLPVLGKSVNSFFASIGDRTDFSAIPALFKALSSLGDYIGKGGGLFGAIGEAFGGSEEMGLVNIGQSLKQFGLDTEQFFANVNALNLGNLNGLWASLKNAGSISTDVSNVVDQNIKNIVTKIRKLPNQMATAIKSGGAAFAAAFVSIWTNAVKQTAKPVNKLLSGVNFVLKEFGSEKRVASWTPYAKGTNGHKGGNALVNDGRGAELVQMPNGRTFIPHGRNVMLPNAPKGMKVLPAEQTAKLMGKTAPTFHYAKGTGSFDVWKYIDGAASLIGAIKDNFVTYGDVSGMAIHFGKSMVSTITSQMSAWAEKLFEEFGAMPLGAYNPSKGVEQWRSTVIRALKMEGQYSTANVARTLYQMQTESGGNPSAINLWDSNAKAGIPSKGLMQVIDPTFASYARPGFNKNIYDPLSNILASIRYAVSRYGSLEKAYRGVGYENGVGTVTPVNLPKYTPEGSLSVVTNTSVQGGDTYAPVFNLTIAGSGDREMARKVKQWVKEAMDEMFDSMSRKNPRLREV